GLDGICEVKSQQSKRESVHSLPDFLSRPNLCQATRRLAEGDRERALRRGAPIRVSWDRCSPHSNPSPSKRSTATLRSCPVGWVSYSSRSRGSLLQLPGDPRSFCPLVQISPGAARRKS